MLHLFPGVGPTTVFDLELLTWGSMALSVDAHLEHLEQARTQRR